MASPQPKPRPRSKARWRIEDFVLIPTREHLSDTCQAVSMIDFRDKIISFLCATSNDEGSQIVTCHYSRIHIHEGPLLKYLRMYGASPNGSRHALKTDQPFQVMQCISDYLYCCHIDLSKWRLENLAPLLAAAHRWKCTALFEGALIVMREKKMLRLGIQYPPDQCLRWLQSAPPSFRLYFCQSFNNISKFLVYPQLLDVLMFAQRAGLDDFRSRVVQRLLEYDSLGTRADLQKLLYIYRDKHIPIVLKEFIVSLAGILQGSWGNVIEDTEPEDALPDKCQVQSPSRESNSDSDGIPPISVSVGNSLVAESEVWKILHREKISYEALRAMVMKEHPDDAIEVLCEALRYLEPLEADERKLFELIYALRGQISDPYKLLENKFLYRKLSFRALRICCASLLRSHTNNMEIQFTMSLSCANIHEKTSILKRASIEGLMCSFGYGKCSAWSVSLFLNIISKDISSLWIHDRFTLFWTVLHRKCKCPFSEEKVGRRGQRIFRVRDFVVDEEGQTSKARRIEIMNHANIQEWCDHHSHDCTLFFIVRLEAQHEPCKDE